MASSASELGKDATFATALASYFPQAGFVAHISSRVEGDQFLALVSRGPSDTFSSDSGPGLTIEVTDCLQGVFRRQLGLGALDELRRGAGMAEFAWPTFFRLLASALRGEEGCGVTAENIHIATGRSCSSTGQGCSRGLRLEFRFQLQAAALVGHLQLDAAAALPEEVLASAETTAFLRELRRFVLGSLKAAAAAEASSSVGSPPRPGRGLAMGSPARRPSAAAAVPEAAAGVSDTIGLFDTSATVGSGGSLTRTPSNPSAPAAAPKKRPGGSLVDPNARKARRGGGNPFQLSSG
ncbi:unnamed protein product [Polarella glacialis]|uniref:Uncharacterized protein n=1 Tax=Polarella glacialis TaxID=89957 RepID=A0A813L701_POLGL|nr:unnamed protein product [Polarella glacialis]CAE8721925.1 unnamed protein product [Polarella glacialis]